MNINAAAFANNWPAETKLMVLTKAVKLIDDEIEAIKGELNEKSKQKTFAYEIKNYNPDDSKEEKLLCEKEICSWCGSKAHHSNECPTLYADGGRNKH